MKKIISVIVSICIVLTIIPFSAYVANITPDISLDEFKGRLQELQAKYDNDFVSEITFENNSEFYYVDGSKKPVVNTQNEKSEAVVSNEDFEIPLSTVAPYAELPESSTYSLNKNAVNTTVDKETAEALGFEVEFEDDKAVLTQPYQTERLIVKSKYDINPLDSVSIVEGYDDLHIVQFDNQESTKQAEEYYNKQKRIDYAEPDLVVSTMEYDFSDLSTFANGNTPGLTYDNHLSWGSGSIGVDDYIDYLGDISSLPKIVVGIIDTGIDLDHEFLKDRIIQTGVNYSDTGYVDSENDDHGHGTHVAGIIADNTTENVKIKAYKCLSSTGSGTTSAIALAISKATDDKVNAINMSLGGRGTSQVFEDYIDRAVANGITVCVSAGNDGDTAANYTPANVDSAVTVAAIDAFDKKPYWSNWGDAVDIVAPGVSIYSTYLDNTYKSLSGTSMATPFVVAATALLYCNNTKNVADNIESILLENGRIWCPESESQFVDSLYGIKALYIGNLTTVLKERTETPIFNFESGRYDEEIALEISCPDEDCEIYYTLDGSRAMQNNGILYTGPIVIDTVTTIHAVAYSEGKIKSLQAKATYYITHTDLDENFVIDDNGLIIEYLGNNNYLTIPDTISGISVTGIGSKVFFCSNLVMIKLPDSLNYIGPEAFSNSKHLKSVYANNIKTVADEAFYDCMSLEDINLSNLETVGEYSFGYCESLTHIDNDKLTVIENYSFCGLGNAVSLKFLNAKIIKDGGFMDATIAESIIVPKVEKVYDRAFEACYAVKELDFPNLTTIGICYMGAFFACESLEHFTAPNLIGEIPDNCFLWCQNLKSVKFDNVVSIGKSAFDNCERLDNVYIPSVEEVKVKAFSGANAIETIFAPRLKTAKSLPTVNNTNIYLSDSCIELPDTKYNYNIIAPTKSYAEQNANENGHTFIPSEKLGFNSIVGNDFVYSTPDGKTCSMPIDIVEQMWYDYMPINKQSDFMTHGYLIDVVNDNFINGKDFAKIHHTAKYGW